MQINDVDVAITGQFDLIFKSKSPEHPSVNWQLLKSLAFNESELQPGVSGGMFRAPERLYYEYEGNDPQDPEDSVKTVASILLSWWEQLNYIQDEDERLLFVLLAYKLRFYNVNKLTNISNNFKDLMNYFSPGLILEVKRIIDRSKVM